MFTVQPVPVFLFQQVSSNKFLLPTSRPRHWLKASISSTVTPQQVLECFSSLGLIKLHFPKYETFFLQTSPDDASRTPFYGAPRYKNIMLEFSDQQHLRLAESTRNETFLCESQLRLHKTTTGFVESEVEGEGDTVVGASGGYYTFDLVELNELELNESVAKALAERERDIASPKFAVSMKGKGSKSKRRDIFEKYALVMWSAT